MQNSLVSVRRSRRSPAVAAILLLVGTVVFWQALVARERTNTERATTLVADESQAKLRSGLELRIAPLDALARRWAFRPPPAGTEWEDDAALFMSAYPGYQSIHWVDASLHVRRSAAPAGSRLPPNLDLVSNPAARTAFASCRRRGVPVATPLFRAPDGGDAFLVCCPNPNRAAEQAFVAAFFRVEDLLRSILDEALPRGFSVVVLDGNRRLYARPPTAPDDGVERRIDTAGLGWRVLVKPDAWSLFQTAGFPQLFLIGGMIVSALVFLAAQSAAVSRRRSRALEHANAELVQLAEARRRAADALADATKTLRAIIDTSPVAIVRLKLDGTVVAWNRAAASLLGWPERDVLGRRFPALGESHELWERIRGVTPLDGHDATLPTRSGKPVEVQIWATPEHNLLGLPSGLLWMLADVSRRKDLERQLRESQRLDAVGQLAAGVAHHYNNLLTIITGYGEVVAEALGSDSPLRKEMQEVLEAAERAAKLALELLAFGRGQTINPEIVDLNQVVTGLKEVIQGILGARIELVMPLAAGLGRVRIDPNQIEHIVMTLVVNAREAMPEGGRLVIETANADIAPGAAAEKDLRSGVYVRLTVTDNGCGMNSEQLRHVFEPFYTTKEIGRGIGLGLSAVYGIARQNGGGVRVSSSPGQGTRVEVYLPRL